MKKTLLTTFIIAGMIQLNIPSSYAETIELVTYYPTTPTASNITAGNINAENITSNLFTIDGEADEPTAFLLEGGQDIVSNVVFLPGEDTGAGLPPEIRLGINTETPRAALDITNGDLIVEGSINVIPVTGGTAPILSVDPTFFPNGLGSGEGFQILSGNSNPETGGFGLNPTDDFLIFEKTDLDDENPDGGTVFVNTGTDNVQEVALTIRGNNDIGIGTVDPQATLHIEDEDNRPTILLEGENPFLRINDNETANNTPETVDVKLFAVNRYGRLSSDKSISVHLDDDNNSDAERFLITSNSTGFGNDTPLMTVHENGGIYIGPESITPPSTAPNGRTGNLSVNDIFLRSTGQFLSQAAAAGPAFDSGWFAVTNNRQYDFRNPLGDIPSRTQVLFSTSPTGAPAVVVGELNFGFDNGYSLEMTNTTFHLSTGDNCVAIYHRASTNRFEAPNRGFYRLRAWR